MTDKSVMESANDRDGWIKSSYSNSAGGSCVEVKLDLPSISIRDSKDRRVGQPVIGISSEGWNSFLKTVVVAETHQA